MFIFPDRDNKTSVLISTAWMIDYPSKKEWCDVQDKEHWENTSHRTQGAKITPDSLQG